MIIYVESNFVLELAFLQEQFESCEKILSICEKELGTLIVPAFSLAEPLEKLHRQKNFRQEIKKIWIWRSSNIHELPATNPRFKVL